MKHQQISAGMYSIEAEQQVLGAVLAVNDRYHEVASMLNPEHFWDPVHGLIWKNIAARITRDHLVSPVTVQTDMAANEGFQEIGGGRYLSNMVVASVSGSEVKYYAKMLVDLHGRRTLAGRLEQLAGELQNGRGADDAAAELELLLHEREETSAEPRTMSFLKAQSLALEQMQEVQQGAVLGVPTGIRALDEVVSMNPKRYTLLGGATSMGKTGLALSIATAAARAGHGVGFVTLEMPEEDLANRINSSVSMVPYKAYDRKMSENTWRQVVEAAKELESLPLEVFSDRVRDVPSILSEGKKLKRKMVPNGEFKGFRLLVIDYIQLVRGRGESAHVRLAQVANDLKQVAKQLDVHVLALAQIDRSIGAREDTRPALRDLRGSGDLENAPDNVLFVHRPEYYLVRQTPPKKEEERADWEAELAHWKGMAEIIVGKARMGEIGSVKVACDMGTNRFFDIPEQQDGWAF